MNLHEPQVLQLQALLISDLTQKEWLDCRLSTIVALQEVDKYLKNTPYLLKAARDVLNCKVQKLDLHYKEAIQQERHKNVNKLQSSVDAFKLEFNDHLKQSNGMWVLYFEGKYIERFESESDAFDYAEANGYPSGIFLVDKISVNHPYRTM